MPATSTRSSILVTVLLLLVAPAQAEGPEESSAEEGMATEGNQTLGNHTANNEACQVVDYSLSKPTSITPDPDRCFIPYILGRIPI